MSAIQAIILGAIQGLTEFIPVSSSGHLIAVPYLLGWNYQGKTFDVAAHLGTLVAVVAFYWRDWVMMFSSFYSHVVKHESYEKQEVGGGTGRLLVPIIIACIPAAIAGVVWGDVIENQLSKWYFVAPTLVIFGALMLVADRLGKKQRDVSRMNYGDYILIGIAQALALFPGVSRSGITITTGLFRGLDRPAAARFSFLLSTPIIFGAGLVAAKHLAKTGLPAGESGAFIAGFISAAIFGYIAIKVLISFLQKNTLTAFAIYRFALAAFLVGVFMLKK
ncbi:MAG: undecaprenyl-diphosphatase UppP [Armatimonadota bacterium]|nr:undecaprenyl-diphosphatase UppP [bacterium]